MESQKKLPEFTVVNRVDIDFNPKKLEKLNAIFNSLNIKGSFFIRLHAPEYNPFSFENYRLIKNLIKDGHEIGYHSEIVDQSKIWNEDPTVCLNRDLKILGEMFGITVESVASHGGFTPWNNLDFWKGKKASEYGLLYEAYEESENFNLWKKAFYISDSENNRWKCYDKGVLVEGDRKSFGDHIYSGHKLIYLLIHADLYYDKHYYE
ncbi:MAG: hypothetical protein CBB97_19305 [Candidatus Endolissoclinum sp. TMED37]|nr:MAG: hypothetical protein CBB97_19305 [Candidatus Endolissoclinum sp. TMED37]|tara:strand:- start:4519 stop:5139 length:621 start_codon:yes stop_codon:yes gene_type:complete